MVQLPVLEILLIFFLFAIVVLEMMREFGCVAGGAGAVFLFGNGFSLLFFSLLLLLDPFFSPSQQTKDPFLEDGEKNKKINKHM